MHNENKNSLGRGISIVLSANIINLVFNLLTKMALPKFLSVETYAVINTFILYLSYSGFLHLGYVDGMYLKYGGKEANSLKSDEISRNISTLFVFQIIIAVVVGICGVVLRDHVIVIFAIVLVPYNLVMNYRLLYQAVGEFELYGRVMNVTTAMTFILNMVLIFIIHTDADYLYVLVYFVVYLVVEILLQLKIKKSIQAEMKISYFSLEEFKDNVKNGFLLMLGNFSSIFLTSMDRWFVKILMDTTAFAQYSFAVSMESFLNTAITPVTVTLYNYFCRHKEREEIIRIRNYVAIFAVALVSLAFPAKFILETWLTNYVDASNVIFFLFASQIFFVIIKSIYVNLYKVKRLQKRYFIKLASVIVIGFFLNILLYLVLETKEAFAVGTLLSSIIWFFLCQFDFKEIRFSVKEYFFLFVELLMFMSCGIYCNAILGGILYLIITIVLSVLLYKKELKRMIERKG